MTALPPKTVQISPNSRRRQFRSFLASHQEERIRFQQRAELRAAPVDMSERLQAALAEIRRIEREFHTFRTGANARLAAALDENEKLRQSLEKIRTGHVTKPAERELEIERLKHASIKPPYACSRERKSLRLPFMAESAATERRKTVRIPIRFSRKWSTCF
eukprot:gb/GEZJ01007230.1/.p1 GENE.gb/GEZJ01007230.1/~~gb/GEZJ01007230.1/.p1  ORF type:complete len:161 (+),score=26.05 gb/GEZJ01007230.1/:647-1129(+)